MSLDSIVAFILPWRLSLPFPLVCGLLTLAPGGMLTRVPTTIVSTQARVILPWCIM